MSTKRRVLVVDDYPDIADIVSVLIKILGYDCRTALSGREALQVVEEFDPEIILLDIKLPDVCGWEMGERLKRRGRRLFLVAVTGYGQTRDLVRSSKAGFDVHITKPADLKIVKRVLSDAEKNLRSMTM